MNTPELLAPAGSPEALLAALRCGADAVYVGARQFSARAHAENFDADALAQAADACHLAGAKLYIAVNTLIFDPEFPDLDALLQTLAAIGADGCIVQDLGVADYIAHRLPTLRLHASTQLTVHTPAGVRLAKQAGFCRAVAARELSREAIAELCAVGGQTGVEIEAFVHGAHCMSVSGQCLMSAAMGGRSANRGCCAQPCRLPFSADGSPACALSLKDMSLVEHLDEMREIGVASLKIEGRMKRPEYVAAAVTACRAALDGRNPDLSTLRAVFSRSGFTDGYFTGQRREMFGTRQKTDVVAAQDVLAPLRELYRRPRTAAVLDGTFVLREGKPAELSVTDEQGRRVTVTGDVPQPAKNRPTDAGQLQKQFAKLGGTCYEPGTVTAALDPGLMLPAAALNALRRDAAAAMDALRIRENRPVHRLAAIPEPPAPPERSAAGRRIRLQIRRLEQLGCLCKTAQELEFLLLPLHLVKAYAAAEMPVPPERCILVPPRFCVNEQQTIDALRSAQVLGFSHVSCQHPGDLYLGRSLGMTCHGGLGLHAANVFAAQRLRVLGAADLLCTPELPGLAGCGVFAYGRLPLMLTRNCPVKAQVGCGKCRHHLTDRRGAAVYTDCTRFADSPDYAELFNAAPVWLADRPAAWECAPYALLSMTDETPERCAEVVRAYLHDTPAAPPAPYTRGLRLADE